jgi:Mat/Ecp fimbriae major subunit
MKTVLRTAVASLAIASLGVSSAAFAATSTADAEAEIIAALTVTLDTANNRDKLDFGTLAESGAGGTITLTPAGSPTCGTGLVCAGPYNTPNFDITGASGATVNISLTNANITLTGPGAAMPLALTLSDVSLVLDGTDAFDVGGTLTVNANQAVGTYTGQMEVNVVYN